MSRAFLVTTLSLVVAFCAYQWVLIYGYRDLNTRLLLGCPKPDVIAPIEAVFYFEVTR